MRSNRVKWLIGFNCILVLSVFMIILGSKNVQAANKTITTDGQWITDHVEDNICLYSFSIPKAGYVSYTFQCFNKNGSCALLNEDLTKTYLIDYPDSWSPPNPSSTNPWTVESGNWFEAGNYCLKVGYFDYMVFLSAEWRNWTGDYRIKLNYTPAENNEAEPNNEFSEAMSLKENATVKGLFSVEDGIDIYKINVTSPQTVSIVYMFNKKANVKHTLMNQDFIELEADKSDSQDTRYEYEKYLSPGTYYIKAECSNKENGTYNIKWTAKQYISKINMKKKKVVLGKGRKYNVLGSIVPANATNPTLSWETSEDSVAKVDKRGTVTAIRTGHATITAKAKDKEDSEVSASCEIIVKPSKCRIKSVKANKYYTGKRYFSIEIKDQDGESGYQIQYARNKKFKKRKSRSSSYTNIDTGKVAKRKKYYIRARAYYEYDGKKYYGNWSKVKVKKSRK